MTEEYENEQYESEEEYEEEEEEYTEEGIRYATERYFMNLHCCTLLTIIYAVIMTVTFMQLEFEGVKLIWNDTTAGYNIIAILLLIGLPFVIHTYLHIWRPTVNYVAQRAVLQLLYEDEEEYEDDEYEDEEEPEDGDEEESETDYTRPPFTTIDDHAQS